MFAHLKLCMFHMSVICLPPIFPGIDLINCYHGAVLRIQHTGMAAFSGTYAIGAASPSPQMAFIASVPVAPPEWGRELQTVPTFWASKIRRKCFLAIFRKPTIISQPFFFK